MNLALTFGIPVEELQQRISPREFALWSHYVAEYGFPWQRQETMTAVVVQAIARIMGGAKGDNLQDYMIKPPKKRAQTERERERELTALFGPIRGGKRGR